MLIQIGIAIIECFIFCDFIFLGMLYKLEFPMYFYCGILNVGEGIEYFLGEKKIMYAVVVTNERASDLAGKSGLRAKFLPGPLLREQVTLPCQNLGDSVCLPGRTLPPLRQVGWVEARSPS